MRFLFFLVVAFLFAGPSGAARISLEGLLKEQPLDQFFHTSWSAREGLFGPVMGLAQTSDGYLWVGTARGLFRFDGIRFEPFEAIAGETLPQRAVMSLHATPDRGLWVGYLKGGLSFVRDGHVVLSQKAENGFEGSTRAFAREQDGTIWVATSRGLFKRDGERWQRMGAAEDYPQPSPSNATMDVLLDGEGALWVTTGQAVLVKPAGQSRFLKVRSPGKAPSYLAVDPQGRVWGEVQFTDENRRYMRLPRPHVPADRPGIGHWVDSSLFMPMFDRRGHLWYGARDGVTRELGPVLAAERDDRRTPEATAAPPVPLVPLRPARASSAPGVAEAFDFAMPALQRLTPNQGLSGDQVLKVFEDRQGTIWIGTNAGLDRLRPTRVSQVQFPVRMAAPAMAAGPRGELWVVSRTGIFHLDPGAPQADLVRIASGSFSASRVLVDHGGTVWLGDRQGASRLGPDGRFIDEIRQAFPNWSGTVTEMAEDTAGRLWIVGQFMGLHRRSADGRWERLDEARGFANSSRINCVTTDGQGQVWLGYDDGQLLRVDRDERITRFDAKDGLMAITPHAGGLWLGGEHGVQRLDADGRFHQLRAAADDDRLNGVSGIVETPDGELWLNGAAGIVRIEAADVRRVIADPATRVPSLLLDTLDGLNGRAATQWPLRTALQASDGRLWFTLTNGLVTVDPAALARSDAVPTITIEHIRAHGAMLAFQSTGGVSAAAGTSELQIDYTATALAVPERARFRYRLVGLDTAWHEADTRRQAFYTNLGPGSYRFEVQATKEDGGWAEAAATMAIEIPPTFVQSLVFKALCGLLALALVAWLARLRGRQLEARALRHYRVRLEERTRIAQDLHDTLLQGVQALLLRFQRVAWMIEEPQARREMERALDQADEVVIDGRNRVADLRRPAPDAVALEQMLEALGTDLAGFHEAAFRIAVQGESRLLDHAAHAELALVAREALFNAFQHARATEIEVTVRYEAEALVLRVSDDGAGVPAQTLEDGQAPGHWGLSGMRERMAKLGGSFVLRSAEGAGTVVELHLPAALAYAVAVSA